MEDFKDRYDITEWSYIQELQSENCSYERTQQIFEYFYNHYIGAIRNYINAFFHNYIYITDFEDIMQESILTFFDYLKYKINKMPIMTGFYPYLHGTLVMFIANKKGLTYYENAISSNYWKMY